MHQQLQTQKSLVHYTIAYQAFILSFKHTNIMTIIHKLSIFFIALLITSHIFAQNTAPDTIKQKKNKKFINTKGVRIAQGISTLYNYRYIYTPIRCTSVGFFLAERKKPFSVTLEASVDVKGGIRDDIFTVYSPTVDENGLPSMIGGYVTERITTKFKFTYLSLSILPTYRFFDNKYAVVGGISVSRLFRTWMDNPPSYPHGYFDLHPRFDFNLIGAYQYVFIEKPAFFLQLDTRVTYGLRNFYNGYANGSIPTRHATAQIGLSMVWK